MLIHLSGSIEGRSEEQEKIKLYIPALFLDHYDYKVKVRSIYLSSNTPIPEQAFFLISDIVDKNPFNLDQIIYSFSTKEADFVLSEPFQPREYRVQLKEIHNCEFLLHCSKGVVGETQIRLLLEITRDVRIQ